MINTKYSATLCRYYFLKKENLKRTKIHSTKTTVSFCRRPKTISRARYRSRNVQLKGAKGRLLVERARERERESLWMDGGLRNGPGTATAQWIGNARKRESGVRALSRAERTDDLSVLGLLREQVSWKLAVPAKTSLSLSLRRPRARCRYSTFRMDDLRDKRRAGALW